MNTASVGGPGLHQSLAWRFAFIASAVFIVYGSLFPFNFSANPKSIDSFFLQWQDLFNSSDAIDNFFLFIPLGIALPAAFRTLVARLLVGISSIALLGIGIQLLQLYLPSRTASLADVFWNAVGLSIGALCTARVQVIATKWFNQGDKSTDPFAVVLVALWLIYESFPFIPSLDIGLLRDT